MTPKHEPEFLEVTVAPTPAKERCVGSDDPPCWSVYSVPGRGPETSGRDCRPGPHASVGVVFREWSVPCTPRNGPRVR